jgi:hypothetical protein
MENLNLRERQRRGNFLFQFDNRSANFPAVFSGPWRKGRIDGGLVIREGPSQGKSSKIFLMAS